MKCGYHFLEEEISKILSEKKKEGDKSKNSSKRTQFYPPKNQKIIIKNKNSSKSTKFLASANLSNKKKKKTKKNKKAKLKNISNKTKYTYNDFEINTFSYEKALSYDKRSFCEFYISLLKTKHPLIFSFCPIKDYNTIIIKSCIFTLSFSRRRNI